jgi:hypothetical protein
MINYLGKSAEFSECGKYRYCLRRIWNTDLPFVMCIGLNPSTANSEDDDTTVRNLCELLSKSGYGGLFMMNLFALISSEPNDLRACPDPLKDNDIWIHSMASRCDDVIFCWGAFKQAEYRAKKLVQKFPAALCLGKTADGHPIHPLAATVWMRSKCKLQIFKSS